MNRQKEWYKNNKEQRNLTGRIWYKNNKEQKGLVGKKWYENNKERRKLIGRSNYSKNKESYRLAHMRYRHSLRLEAINVYGGALCKCGESRVSALTIHHKDNNGANHRRKLGLGSNTLIKWLKKNNFPPGFEVLCFNCNWLEHLKYNRCKTPLLKQEFMNRLGGKCKVCNKQDVRILTTHHIKHDGAEHRQQLTGRRRNGSSATFYKKILESGDFSNLECRCLSCNCVAENELRTSSPTSITNPLVGQN